MNTDRLVIYVDIETTGTASNRINDYVIDAVRAPANYKDEAKIEAYKAEKREEAWASTALLPHFGQVACIGIAINDDEPEVMAADDEVQVLNNFVEFAKISWSKHNKRIPLWCGFNVMFDLRFLWTRCLVNGVSLRGVNLQQMAKEWNTNYVLDLRYVLTCGERYAKGSLKEWCLAFGFDIDDDDIDGADVPKAWTVEALRPRVMEHCYRDVVRCQMIHERLKGMGA